MWREEGDYRENEENKMENLDNMQNQQGAVEEIKRTCLSRDKKGDWRGKYEHSTMIHTSENIKMKTILCAM